MLNYKKAIFVEIICGFDDALDYLVGNVYEIMDRSETYDYILDVGGDLVEVPLYCCLLVEETKLLFVH